MLNLCGFSVSNYYNKVKLALLEKGIPFEEELVYPSQDEDFLVRSPMGKVPFLEVDGTRIAESQVIVEYLEDAYPEPPLYPRDPLEKAKCRELIQFIELHLELPARRLHMEAFFGGKVSEETKKAVSKDLEKGAKAFARLARFDPFMAGKDFTYADCAAYCHLPVVSQATKAIYGRDFLEGIEALKPYLKRIAGRPHAQRVSADRKATLEAFMAMRTSKQA